MLFITGLLTLLAIAQAGGDHIKGGSRIKGGSIAQEQIAQADIPASLQSFNVKTEVPFGSKVTRQDVVHTDGRTKTAAGSKTAISPSLHHSVKTVADALGKTQPSPSLHHTSALPVAQDQVIIDNPTTAAGIKSLKAAASGKTRFSQPDIQVRDPVAYPVGQTVKTVQDPAPLSTKSVGTRKTKLRDTATSPVIQTVKNVAAPSTGSRQIKTVGTTQNRFIQDDRQTRDPIARPVIQTAQVTSIPTADTSNRVKTLKTAASGKTRFSHDDSQTRDHVSEPVLQQVKTAAASSAKRKTTTKTLQSSNPQIYSNIPQSVVNYARRDSVLTSSTPTGSLRNEPQIRTSSLGREPIISTRSEIQSTGNLPSFQGGLTLDEETFNLLQNAGGITTENGEIAINDKGLKILEANKDANNLLHSSGSLSTINEGRRTTANLNNRVINQPRVTSETLLRTPDVGQRQGVSSLDNKITTGGRPSILPINRNSGLGTQTVATRTQTVLFNGKEISLAGAAEGQIFDENLQPLSGIARGPQRPDIRSAVAPQITKPDNRPVVRSRTQTATVSRDQLRARTPIAASGVSPGSGRQIIGTGAQTVGTRTQTVWFNGKEISLTGAAEGQIFDENLQPISGLARGPQTPDIRAAGAPQITKPATRPVVRSRTQTATVSRDQLRARTPIAASGISAGGGRQIIGTGPQTVGTRTQTVLFNGKEISLTGASEGQIFDENLQPLSGLARGPQTPDIRAAGAPQITKPATRPVLRSRTQTATVSRDQLRARTPIAASGISAGGGRQIIGTGPQTVGTRTQTVLFNGKEISLTGAAEGQIFDENLQPLSGIARGPQKPDIRAAGAPQITKPATRQVLRSRTQTATASRDQLRARTPIAASGISAGGGRQIIGTGPQTVGTRTQTVLFNGKEISLTGAAEGQIFDENLQPLSGIARGPQTPDIRAAGAPQITKPATRAVLRSRTQTATVSRDQLRARTPIAASGISAGGGRQIIGTGPQTVGTRTQTVLFNGKEISLTGAAEGQIFDENLQPLSGISRGPQTPDVRAAGAPQITKPATRQVLRSRTQTATASRDQLRALTPIAASGISAGGGRQIIGTGPQTVGTRTQTVGTRTQTVGTRTQTVLFNGKEISLTGAAEGQIFDENLQPLSGIARGPQTPDIRAAFAPQITKPATRPVLRSRTQTATVSRDQLRARTPIAASGISAGGGRQVIGTGPQTVGTRTQTVLFNGKEISLTEAAEGQIFDENLQPLSGLARGPQTPDIRAAGAPQITKPATRQVLRSRTQTATASRDQLRARTPIAASGISAGGGRQIIGTGPQTVGTRTQTVLFNGKEISLTGAAEGQIFDENLQPLSGIARGPQTPDIRAAGAPQITKPATRPVLRSRTQTATVSRDQLRTRTPIAASGISVGGGRQIIGTGPQTVGTRTQTVLFNGKEISLIGAAEGQIFDENLQPLSGIARGPQTPDIRAAGAPEITKPATRPVLRSRTQTTTVSRDQLRARTPIAASGISAGGGRQIIGTGPQTVGTRTQTVLFNGKEISLTGAAEGQIFDENLQPLSGIARGPQTPDIRAAGAPQITKPATRQVLRSRTQTATASRDQLRARTPIAASGISAGGGRQIIGTGPQTVGTRTQTVLFNGKEISLTGAAEGQIFDENLQPLSGIARGPQTPDIRAAGAPQITKPATRPVLRSRTQTATVSRDQLRTRTPIAASGISVGGGRQIIGTGPQTVGTRTQTVLFNGKEISLTGAAEGQIFDENLQPLSGIARGPQTPDIRAAGAPQITKPATRPVLRSRTQTTTVSRDQLRARTPIAASGISAGGGRQIIGTGPQTVGTRTQTVLFNGKEISLTGAAEGQIFDENLQPLSGIGRGPQTPDIRAAGAPQITKPATRPVLRSRTQTATVSRDQLRAGTPIASSGVSAGGGRQIIGTGAQTVGTRTETVLFNGNEVSLTGAAEGQIFDENLRPISSISGGPQTPEMRTAGQVTKPATRPVVRSRTQPATASRDQLNVRTPIAISGVSAGSGRQMIGTGVQTGGTRAQTVETRAQTVLFNGKEITLTGAAEGQIFDENLQPLSGIARQFQTTEIRGDVTPQVIKPAIRQIISQNSPTGSDSLPFIDVTRTVASQASPVDNRLVVSRYNALYGSRGGDSRGKTSQEKIAQDQVEASLTQQKEEIIPAPDVQQKIFRTEPSTKTLSLSQKTLDPTESKQTQLKVDEILEQKPSGFTQITQVSQKNIDIPTVQQKLLGGDFSEYLPKSSFLPPFNYALPQLAQSKYSVKRPIIQEQQKMEQFFV